MWFGWNYSPLWRRKLQPTPVLLPGKSHGWRRLVGCSPWCGAESDMTERLHSLSLPIYCPLMRSRVAQRLKRLPAMWETWVQSLGWEDPLGKEMATHSSILAWRIPWMEDLGGLESHGWRSLVGYSPRGRKESETTERLHFTSLHFILLLVQSA